MAKRFKVRELEALHPDFEQRLVKVVNQYNGEGQKVAAEIFGLSQSSVSTFLTKRGYKRVVRYEKEREKGDEADRNGLTHRASTSMRQQ